jgi:hypothetical protein
MNLWDEDKAWLKLLRDEYKELIGKNVPVAKINDVEFIKKAIAEAKANAESTENSSEESSKEENTEAKSDKE